MRRPANGTQKSPYTHTGMHRPTNRTQKSPHTYRNAWAFSG